MNNRVVYCLAAVAALHAASFRASPASAGEAAPDAAATARAEAAGEDPAADPEASVEAMSSESYEDLLKLWGETAKSGATPIENLSLPLESHPNGRVKAMLHADMALVPVEGVVRAKGIVVELYDKEGVLECLLISDNCIFDRATQRGYCEGPVRIERRDVRISGEGMVWMVREQGAKILSRATVRLNRFTKDMGGLVR